MFNPAALRGQEGMVRQLSSRPDLSHGYIISGYPEDTRRSAATAIAQAMMCTSEGAVPCGKCPPCTKVANGIHPDCTTISPLPKKRDILVDQLRQLRSDAFVLPNEGKRKVFIIDQATQMNEAAQNVLLKILEEGPSYVAFLLLASHPDLLLATIRSRCEVLTLAPLEEERLVTPEGQAFAQLLAQGSEIALLEYVLTLDKLDKDKVPSLLDSTLTALMALPVTSRTVKAAALLKDIQSALVVHVSVGALTAALCATLFTQS